MNITGIIVYAHAERSGAVRGALASIGGVVVHAVAPEGHMVVTVEQFDDRPATETFDIIAKIDGVLSTALVYHHDEALTEPANR